MKMCLLSPKVFIPKNLESSNLGYVRPDKTIKFQSPAVALDYAKNTVVKALKSDKPHEKCVLIDNDVIVKQFKGDHNGVDFNTDGLKFDTMVHGHPDAYGEGLTYPINFTDIIAFFENTLNGIKRSIVYNSKGEYSMVEALPRAEAYNKLSPFIREEFIKLDNRRNLAKSIRLEQEHEKVNLERFKELKRTGKLKELAQSIDDENFFATLLAKVEIPILHKMLKENAPELKLAYKTNFSNIKD